MLININMNVNLIQTGQTATLFAILYFVSSIKSGTRLENDSVQSFELGIELDFCSLDSRLSLQAVCGCSSVVFRTTKKLVVVL